MVRDVLCVCPQVSVEVPVEVTRGGSITGVAYWYTFHLFEDLMFSTAPSAYQEVSQQYGVCMKLARVMYLLYSVSLAPVCVPAGRGQDSM